MKTLIYVSVLAALAAVAASVVVGINSFDGTVTETPYERGLAWDEEIRKMEVLGWDVELDYDILTVGENPVDFLVKDKEGSPLAATGLQIKLSRPATDEHDHNVMANVKEKGFYSAVLDFPLYGYWDILMNVSSNGDSILFEKRVFVNKTEVLE